MSDSRNLLAGKPRYLFGLIILAVISVLCVAFSMRDSADFDIARREILLRRIGHEVLLQSGDSTSRVLPVKKTAADEYRISFEKDLSFQPDSLVNLTRRLLANDPFTNDYVVNVLKCGSDSVAYGFAISSNKKNDIITCTGRKQPTACYMISVKFKPTHINTAKTGYLLGGLSVLALIGFILLQPGKQRKRVSNDQSANRFNLGAVLFDAQARQLIINNETIDLTETESRILLIFAQSPNEIIERSRLQKEIWEDEGVIVGRSLDMFISKLRKKLEPDPGISIVVVRSKGYKLEIK
ncbi:MAG: transcriptional regulator [Citrobacter freundii]|nr:MAG: transcriptional regulator [Citrobacter freundii]